jgi:16S rRNA processing protein RimM
VLVDSLTDVPGRLENLKDGTVRLANGNDVAVMIEQSWRHADHWVMKFAGIDSIEAAERFRGGELWIPTRDRGVLPTGEYFRTDLLGCVIRDEAQRLDVGSVVGFQQYGGPLLLEVNANGREILIPFVPDICRRVDLESKVIEASLPDGLLDL